MKPLVLLLALLAPFSLAAQWQLTTTAGAIAERPAGPLVEVGNTVAGDRLDTDFFVINAGSTPAALTRLSISGAGFTLHQPPSLPQTIPAGGRLRFQVRFAPTAPGSYSASLQVNDLAVLVRGSSPAAAAVEVRDGTELRSLSAGTGIGFGRISWDASATRALRLSNPNAVAVSVTALRVTGEGFGLTPLPVVPLTLMPGEALWFEIALRATAPGSYRGELTVDQRSFPLDATRLPPPFPEPEIIFGGNYLDSAIQGRLTIRLAAPAPTDGAGSLSLEFLPAVRGGDDPAVIFTPSGLRTLAFTVPGGHTNAQFGSTSEAIFQTGTTAGTLIFTARLGDHTRSQTITVSPAKVAVNTPHIYRSATGLELRLSGYDNTRSCSEIRFQFYDRQGRVLGTGPIRTDVRALFRSYFDNGSPGGLFRLQASFPVAGNAAEITGVEIEFLNLAGSTQTQRISF